MEQYVGPVLSLLGVGMSGLIAWVWSLWRSHIDLHRKVLEEYPKSAAINELKSEIHALREVVYRIAIKMEVPVFSETYRK